MIKILLEDDYVCVVDKPAGVVVNEANSTQDIVTVQKWFCDKIQVPSSKIQDCEFMQKGGIVHRLDKDTSGVMVLAKTLEAYEGLKQQFLERKTQKTYIALIHGQFSEPAGLISLPIERNTKNKFRFAVGTDPSRMGITEWKTLNKYQNPTLPAGRQESKIQQLYSLMELKPHTGRTHQLRVHMAHFSHPIVSDPIYGFRKTWRDDLVWCPRLFLHAQSLAFVHPTTHETMTIQSKLPDELERALSTL